MSSAEPRGRAAATDRTDAAAAPLFFALGDETRYRLLAQLAAAGPASASGLGAHATVSRQQVMKHLGVLAGAGLVRSRRAGRERIWELDPDRLHQAHAYLDAISRQWDSALDRLARYVER